MLSFKNFILENILDKLSGGSHGHYGHVADNVLHGAHSAVAAHSLVRHMVDRGSESNITPQKKTDGSVSVVTVRNSRDSRFHNPKFPESHVGVAYKGRMDAKTVPDSEKVSYSQDDIKKNYGADHHLTPVLGKLLDHVHKIHGNAPIIQHDIHTVNPEKDIHHENGKASWQPNTIRNSTTDPETIKKLKASKIVIASHTKFDKDFHDGSGFDKGDVKQHPDVYNLDLNAHKPKSSELGTHLQHISGQLKSKSVRSDLDKVGSASYNSHLERFVNSKINKGEYGDDHHKPLDHEEFTKFVSDSHDKEIGKVKTEKAKAVKTAEKDKQLAEIKSHGSALKTAFDLHHTFTKAAKDYVHLSHSGDTSPIKHELPDGKGGFEPSAPEGFVPRSSKYPLANSQKLNSRADFNRTNKMQSERFKKPVTEEVELDESLEHFNRTSDHAVVTIGRFAPFHKDHENLVDAVKDHAKSVGADHHIFTTRTQDNKKNPFTPKEKVAIIRKARPDLKGHVHDTGSVFGALGELHKKGYKKATVVLGDDRTDELQKIHDYNGKFDKKGNGYHFPDGIEVKSRHDIHNTKDADGSDGVHASDIRKAAKSGDTESVKKAMPGHTSGMYSAIIKRIKDRVKD